MYKVTPKTTLAGSLLCVRACMRACALCTCVLRLCVFVSRHLCMFGYACVCVCVYDSTFPCLFSACVRQLCVFVVVYARGERQRRKIIVLLFRQALPKNRVNRSATALGSKYNLPINLTFAAFCVNRNLKARGKINIRLGYYKYRCLFIFFVPPSHQGFSGKKIKIKIKKIRENIIMGGISKSDDIWVSFALIAVVACICPIEWLLMPSAAIVGHHENITQT